MHSEVHDQVVRSSEDADSLQAVHLHPAELCDPDILSVLCDLFACRTATAFGEELDWWLETLQCDLSPKAAAGVALSVISKWHFDQRDGADGVQQFKDELVLRARQILNKGGKR
ncbi:MAG: hypothetical protein K0S02_1648 [Achromobacter mucicolens]|jgi:hypothetical protein|uniref:hypothetical protein n=1 Tax=Achromobacter mucicolens TaxID=1389922 RepID=UPI00242FC2F5|nr:hypothetical protein [Achromobacter mucicolens]MDF2861376.1 hypothetical protein [Achromobacter mucicolens]